MRELWNTGVMHNRIRMVTASFLIKNLLIDWRRGEQWFWDTLVDADGASNPFNWQWVAGSGADAAPYFRVFNPELQAKKFDPHGAVHRRSGRPEYRVDSPEDPPSRSSTSARRGRPRWPRTSRCAARRADRRFSAGVSGVARAQLRQSGATARADPRNSGGRRRSTRRIGGVVRIRASPRVLAGSRVLRSKRLERQEPPCLSPSSPTRRRIRPARPSTRPRRRIQPARPSTRPTPESSQPAPSRRSTPLPHRSP